MAFNNAYRGISGDEAKCSAILKVIDRLSPIQRLAVNMFYCDGLSAEKIADILDMTLDEANECIEKSVAYVSSRTGMDIDSELTELLTMDAQITYPQEDSKKFTQGALKEVIKRNEPKSTRKNKNFFRDLATTAAIVSIGTAMFTFGLIEFKADIFPQSKVDQVGSQQRIKDDDGVAGGISTDTNSEEKISDNSLAESTEFGETTFDTVEIVFDGGECNCGHINPKSVSITGLDVDAKTEEWGIVNRDNDKILLKGSKKEISEKLKILYKNKDYGNYTAEYSLKDKDGNEVKFKRNFQISKEGTQQ